MNIQFWEYSKNLTSSKSFPLLVLSSKVWQFERLGYFVLDSVDTSVTDWVFNRVVALKDTSNPKTMMAVKQKFQKISRKTEQEKQLQEKLAKAYLDPREMFRSQVELYSAFDLEGLPTHDSQGQVLSKNALKKLKKEWTKQKKVFDKNQHPL